MDTTKQAWQELRSFALVMLLIAAVCATAVSSCGSGGGGSDSNGELCQQCGQTDGQCQDTVQVTGDARPSFCGTTDPCTVKLRCLRKLDSAQRRCFPADPATNALDILYRCDGSRPNPSVAPTTTLTPTPTLTASDTPTPTSTGPTATGSTATPTESTPAPTPTASPEEVTVDIAIDDDTADGDFSSSFEVTVTYPSAKGNFLNDGATDCPTVDDGLTPQDNGSGTLTLTFPGDSTDAFPVGASCTFHQAAGQTLVVDDLTSNAPDGLIVDITP